MRKTNEAALATHLISDVHMSHCPKNVKYVLDGGAFLHRVKWPPNATYKEVIMQYPRYVKSKYGICCIIFDRYSGGPSIKDHEHELFLSNKKNKTQFVNLFRHYLTVDGYCHDALNLTCDGHSVVVVADDTDILVLLLYHWKPDMQDLYMRSEMRCRNTSLSLLNIRDIVQKIDSDILKSLLAIHVLGGTDTTSSVYGHGKCSILKTIWRSQVAVQCLLTLGDFEATKTDVVRTGTTVFYRMYGGKPGETLNSVRYLKSMEYIATSKVQLQRERLPPTERAAYFHIPWVHLQIVIWKYLGRMQIDPRDWGWEVKGGVSPIMTDLEPAPEELLRIVRCK